MARVFVTRAELAMIAVHWRQCRLCSKCPVLGEVEGGRRFTRRARAMVCAPMVPVHAFLGGKVMTAANWRVRVTAPGTAYARKMPLACVIKAGTVQAARPLFARTAALVKVLARITGRVYVTSDSKEKIALFSLTVASEEHESVASASAIPATMVTSANRIDVRTAESMPIWTSSSQSLSARVMGNARTMVVCVTQASPVTTVLP